MSHILEPIVRRVERRPPVRRGRIVVTVDRKSGKPRADAGPVANAISDLVRDTVLYEISTDEKLWIDNASADIAIFPTNERSQLMFRMRITASADNAVAIAQALHDDKLSPGEVLLKTVRTYLDNLLEHSAQHGPESVIERIALNRVSWEREIARIVEQKLHLQAEIRFDIQRPIIDTDVTVRAEAIPVIPKDAPHATFPITVTIVLERAQAHAADPLPRSKEERLNLLSDVVIKTFRDELTLFAYWFRPSEVTNELAKAMNAILTRYSYTLKSLAIDPIKPPAPVPAEEQIVDVVNWTGRLARPIPFHIETKVRMMSKGGGIYHAQNLPNRKEWIKTQVHAALQSAMHGRDFLDLTAEAEREVHDTIHRHLNAQALTIGHEVDTFVASAAIPEKVWLGPVTVQVEKEIYKTKNDLVPAEFEIGLVVQFRTLARLEQLIQKHALSRPNDTADGANDAIRDAIKASARRAAARTMAQIEPAKYFSTYEKWEIPGDGDGMDGQKSKEESQRNHVRDEIVHAVKTELKADFYIDRCEVNPRRVDSSVAAIIKVIERIGDITTEAGIEPRGSTGPHESVPITVVYHTGHVAPEEWAAVIQRGAEALNKERLATDLENWTREFLRGRSIGELYNLPLKQDNSPLQSPTYPEVRLQLEAYVQRLVTYHYGFTVGIKSLDTKYHDRDEVDRRRNALDTNQKKAFLQLVDRHLKVLTEKSDEEQRREHLLRRRAIVQQLIESNARANSEDIRRLEGLEEELEKIERQLAESNNKITRQPAVLRLAEPEKPEAAAEEYADKVPEILPRDTSL